MQLLIVVCEVWFCVPGMAMDTSSGTGRRQPMVRIQLLGELAMMLYDAMDFASEAGSLQGLDYRQPCGVEACVVGCVVWGQQATNQQCHQHDLYTYSCPHYVSVSVCVLKFWSRRGCMKA